LSAPSAGDLSGVVQHVRATAGFAYGVIGADIHLLGDGTPLYILESYLCVPATDPQWLRELPSRMLSARFAVVGFTGRESEKGDLLEWCQTGPRLAVRWLYAPGGQGKTRLAAQVADELIGGGWKVVSATHGPGAVLPPLGSQDMRLANAKGLLLIIDYADRWSLTHLTWLFSNALLHQSSTLTRVLLLARTAYAWPALRQELDHYQAGTSEQLLPSLPREPEKRERVFIAARDSFAPHYGLTDTSAIAPPAQLDRPDWDLTLTVHMAALAAVDSYVRGLPAPKDPVGLTAYLLDRERTHWTHLYENRARSDKNAPGLEFQTPPSVMSRATFTAALTGPVSHPLGKRILDSLDLELPSDRILTDHAACYPPADPGLATVLEPLYPDRLAEDFLGVSMPGHAANQPAYAWAPPTATTLLGRGEADVPAIYTPRAITFLAAAAERWPHLGDTFLYPLLRDDPQLAIDAGSAALAALAFVAQVPIDVLEAIERLFTSERHADLDPGIAVVVRRLTEHRLSIADKPGQDAQLYLNLGRRLSLAGDHRQALQATEEAARIYRSLAISNPQRFDRDLSKSLTNLGMARFRVGRWEEALAATEEAVELLRRPHGENLAAPDPDLATSLNNLSLMQSQQGQREEALRTIEAAVEIRRRLVADNPSAFEADLAMSLANLCVMQSALGRRTDALPVAEEAVDLFRGLAAANPAAFEPELATSLINLGNRLRQLGRWEEALQTSEEALEIRRRLVAANPAAFEADLAMSLGNLGSDMSYLGRRAEALAVTRECVELYRRLAADNPAAFEPHLASSLDNLGTDLSRANQQEEALAAAEEGTDIRRRLVAGNRAAFEADLAMSLTNLGNRMFDLGRRDEAMAVTKEAVEIYRRLAETNPAGFQPYLAGLLDNLGADLSHAGQLEEALDSTREAVEIYRQLLAKPDMLTFESDLAMALANFGSHLSALARQGEALEAIAEAVELFRRLAARNPAEFEPYLAGSLGNLGRALSEMGQREDALDATREAAELCRRLVAGNPTAFEPYLAEALDNLGRCMSDLDRQEEAMAVTEEAVGLYRQLAVAHPVPFELNLAAALDNLGLCMSALGRGEPLAATNEALDILRQLAAADLAALEPHLAVGLWIFGRVRAAARLELLQAQAAVQESITIYQRLMRLSSHPFADNLRRAKGTLADLLEELGRSDEASAIRREVADWDASAAD
jgi:tetratricopeptide (TPR) repeat protein